jgi:formylglycine-generating enzyme required for sulfatase activity
MVGDTRMPRFEELPEAIRPLARRNAVRLTHERFGADAQGLIAALQRALEQVEAARKARAEMARQAQAEEERKREEAAANARVKAQREAEEQARRDKEQARLTAIAGLSADQIAKAEELANWEFIKASASAQDFRDHLARFPRGVAERFARARLEDLVWAGLGTAPTLDQLGDFLVEFPQGTHAKAAADRCAALERERGDAEASRESGRRETEAWAAASSPGDAAALAAFLKEWPQGLYADAARARIRELKSSPSRSRLARRLIVGLVGALVIAAIGSGTYVFLLNQAAHEARAEAEAKRRAEEDAARIAIAEKSRAEQEARAEADRKRAETEAKRRADEDVAMAEKSRAEQAARAEADRKRADAEAKGRADELAARRDPALSVAPGSGQSFRDRLANGQPCPMCPEMVVVPAGEFLMGTAPSEIAVLIKETNVVLREEPQHRVAISWSFAVGRYPVTFTEWDACIADGGCNSVKPDDSGWGRGYLPVINVNFDDAKAYAAWLSRKTGKPYRLLSEAEREYATRAGTTTAFWSGPFILTSQANYNAGTGEYQKKTVPVHSFEPNPWGLYQVHGNVYEWVEDCWHNTYRDAPSDGSAWTTACSGGSSRVVRGGSWLYSPRDLRSASRNWYSTVVRNNIIGFRVARTLNP